MINLADWIARQVDALRQIDVWKDSVTTTSPAPSGTGFVIDIDGKHVIAQFVVWTTGAMEATAGTVDDGHVFYIDAATITDETMLDERWRHFCSAIVRIEGHSSG